MGSYNFFASFSVKYGQSLIGVPDGEVTVFKVHKPSSSCIHFSEQVIIKIDASFLKSVNNNSVFTVRSYLSHSLSKI